MLAKMPLASRRLPAYILNGLTVALGIGVVQLLTSRLALALGDAESAGAQSAVIGAICASLPHLPDRAGRAARRVVAGGVLGCVTVFGVLTLKQSTALLGALIPVFVFGLMMMLAWGTRAGPIAFSGVLGIVFSLASPTNQPPLSTAGWGLVGVGVYAVCAWLSTWCLESSYRTLAVAACLRKSAGLLRARAALVEVPTSSPGQATLEVGLVEEEAMLSSMFQAARDLVFHAHDTSANRRTTAVLLRAMDVRDLTLASRLDLELLGSDEVAAGARQWLANGLRAIAFGLDDAESVLRDSGAETGQSTDWVARVRELASSAVAAIHIADDDFRRPLLPVIFNRLNHLAEMVARLHVLLKQADVKLTVGRAELQRFAADEGWPRSAITSHLSLDSPVFRHALRSALAVGAVFWFSHALPWSAHPHWLILTVVVVLRGTVYETLSRRNARVFGTAIGCVLAVALVRNAPDVVLRLAFLVAVGTAHAFVSARYLLTAVAATVMALLQIHFVSPQIGASVVERLVDTLIGAAFAWGFSYVLPSWERRGLPRAVARAVAALRSYADTALTPSYVIAESRLARQRVYDELDTLRSTLPRIAAEPQRVRPPVRELGAFIDRAQILLAHLSSVRLILVRRKEQLEPALTDETLREARGALVQLLTLEAPSVPEQRPPQPSELDLPLEPPDREALPWLSRRLRIALRDGARVGAAARLTLDKLGANTNAPLASSPAQRQA